MSLHKMNYTKDMLKEAFKAVQTRGVPIRRAAREHGIPESTLRLRLADGKPEAKFGAPTIFTRIQEEQLADHCVRMAHLGYGYTRWQIIDMAKNMCQITGKTHEPTKHWFYGFINRFSDIKMVNPKKREKSREDAANPETMKNYFSELTQTLEKLDIKDVPAAIWNVDETAINLDHSPPKILAKSGTHPHVVTAGRSANTTLIAAGSALGQTIPPYIIFKGERISKDKRSKGLKGTQYRATSSGWSNSETFLDFFKNHFVQHVTTRPCLLLYDGHSTHINADIIEIARQENIHLFVLPPHTSHILQPLDVSVFSPFKKSLNSEFHKYLHQHPNSVITIDLLPEFIANCYNSAMSVSNIMTGFRKSGVFPLDPAAPVVTTPTVSKNPHKSNTTRKERKDNRSVRILFEEKDSNFSQTKENCIVKNRKRKSFIPPFGADITKDSFFCEAKVRQEAKNKQEMKEQEKNKNSEKAHRSSFVIITDEEKENEIPPKKTKLSKTYKKGKGPLNSKSGKAPVKKQTQQLVSSNENGLFDEEKCCVCHKWQPDGLHLERALKFVSWGQCNNCDKWVHLKFCTQVEALGDDDDFLCPGCSNEQ